MVSKQTACPNFEHVKILAAMLCNVMRGNSLVGLTNATYLPHMVCKNMLKNAKQRITMKDITRCLFGIFGGAEEDRTPDLRIANATLSQLSYRPIANDFIG